MRQTYRYSYQRQSKDYKFWTMSLVFNWDKLLVCKPATKLIDSCFPSWVHQTGTSIRIESHGSGCNGAQQGQLVHIQTIPILNLIWGWLTMKIYEISKWLGRVSSSYTSYFLIFLGYLESQHFLTHSHIKAILTGAQISICGVYVLLLNALVHPTKWWTVHPGYWTFPPTEPYWKNLRMTPNHYLDVRVQTDP